MEYILTFGSTHRVLKVEELLKGHGVSFKLLPAPKELSRYCDLVISVDGLVLAEVRDILSSEGVEPKGVYRKEDDRYVEV